MAKDISILKNKITAFITSNPVINCIDLSLLQGLQKEDLLLVKIAVAAGADIYLELEDGSELVDIIVDYLQDPHIVKFFMEILLEDAVKEGDQYDISFAIKNGASWIHYLSVIDKLSGDDGDTDIALAGYYDETIEVQ